MPLATSETDPLLIHFLTSGEEPDLLRFYQANLDRYDLFQTLWSWRNGNAGASGGETAVIAGRENRLVGAVGIVPVDMRINGEPIRASWQQDSLIAASERGKGVGKKLVSAAAEPYDLVMAKGTSRAMYGLRKSMGYSDVPYSDYLLAVNSPETRLKHPAKSLLFRMLWLWKQLLPLPRENADLPVREISAFEEAAYDHLAEKMSRGGTFGPYKSAAYLNWRYMACPVKQYTVFQAGNDDPRGAVVLGFSAEAPMDGWVVDLICPSDDKQCACRLLTAAMRFFKQRRFNKIWTFATLPAARRWLLRFGFVPTRISPRFTCKFKDESRTPASSPDIPWNIWHGDGDLELYL
ncbi:MAG: hypothetical protein ACOZF0_00580 [Thermodesulfobacteriota bacterium]